jgi:hypothetical protein
LRDKKHVEMKGHRFMFPVRVLEKRRIFWLSLRVLDHTYWRLCI